MARRAAQPRAGPVPQFIGPPGRLRLAGLSPERLTTLQEVILPDTLPHSGRVALRHGRDGSRLRLRLPPGTPPGEYTVALRWADGERQDVSLSVAPRSRLRITPSALRLSAAPGAVASATLLVENRGNVAVEIGEALFAGLFDDDGIEAAMASTYRLDTDDVTTIVGNIFARLREAHGGLLKLRVRAGAGVLALGEGRIIDIEARLSEKLTAGHGYHGMLELGTHGIAVEVQVLRPEKE